MKPPKLRRNGDGRAFAVFPGTGGRRAYFGVYGSEEAAGRYAKWLDEVMSAIASGEPFACDRREDHTLTNLADIYLPWAEAYYAESGEFANVNDTVRLLIESVGDVLGRDFGPNALREFQGHLIASGRFARTTINSHVNRVRRFLKWCQSRELLPRGASEDLATVAGLRRGKTTARETQPVGPVPWVVVRATLPFLGPVVRSMVLVQFWSGCRPGEVCRMSAADIEATGPVWLYRPGRHKTAHHGRSLTKAIPEPIQAIVRAAMDARPEGPLFLTVHDNPFRRDTYTNAVHRGVEKARAAHVPVPKWSPNKLRHAILTDIRDRFGIEAAQAYAGHARPEMTAHYTRETEALLRRIAAELSGTSGPFPPTGRP